MGELGLFISDTQAKRLLHPHGVACVFSRHHLLYTLPGCQPITLEQAWRDAGLKSEPWVLCRSAPIHEETMVFLNEALFVFATRTAAGDRAAHMNRLGGGSSHWIARTLRDHLGQMKARVRRAVALFETADDACASLIAALPTTVTEERHAS